MKFAESEAQFRQLKAQLDAGTLSEADFKARLQDLMIQDEHDRWWMIGYETGQWYVHDGEKWVRGEPPISPEETAVSSRTPEPSVAPPVTPEAARSRPGAPLRRLWLWVGAGVFGVILLAIVIAQLADRPQPTPTLAPSPTRVPDMVYVPAGEFPMGSTGADTEASIDEKPQHRVYLDAFWIDRTEVTKAQYQQCVEAGVCTAPRCSGTEQGDHPVVCVTWYDASKYCAWAERRLPTEAEWEKAARGTDGRKYPWGNQDMAGDLLNFCDGNCSIDGKKDNAVNDGYAKTAPVGSYPAGASPYGALDMTGNVWEWVADRYDEKYYANSPVRNPQGPDSGTLRVDRGGSSSDDRTGVRAARRGTNLPDVTNVDILGFRCARSLAPTSTSTRIPPTSAATTTLAPGATRVSEGMVMVYVPTGEFLMGSPQGEDSGDEQPQHSVTLDDYWIMSTEVTNAEYGRCVDASACEPPADGNRRYLDAGSAELPVTGISWSQAQAYAEWAGGRLPTEAEWEKACRGIDGGAYPWGNQGVAGDLLNFCDSNCPLGWRDNAVNDGYAETAPVGSYPKGASPYGALDMAGNVWEWTADWYDRTYYADSPKENPTGPANGDSRVLRGGSFSSSANYVRCSARSYFNPDFRGDFIGFRVVVSPGF